jgi:hypothetical protein
MPDDAPVMRNRFPLRSTPESTSSAVDFAPDFSVISFPLIVHVRVLIFFGLIFDAQI